MSSDFGIEARLVLPVRISMQGYQGVRSAFSIHHTLPGKCQLSVHIQQNESRCDFVSLSWIDDRLSPRVTRQQLIFLQYSCCSWNDIALKRAFILFSSRYQDVTAVGD